jgi:hypothetical protein
VYIANARKRLAIAACGPAQSALNSSAEMLSLRRSKVIRRIMVAGPGAEGTSGGDA